MTEREFLYLIAGAGIVFLLMHTKQQPVAPVQQNQTQEPMGQPVIIQNGQPYYNVTFSNNGNINNPLALEYMPLFGFIPQRGF